MAEPSTDYPFKTELDMIQYLRQATGTGLTGKYNASSATPAQASLIDQTGLSSIMTEWLRGNGNFLQNMQQQNQSGLYNSSTRRLVANDLTAQAALKAATANQEISKTNATLANNVAIENAKMQSTASAVSAKSQSQGSKLLDLALAAGTSMLKGSTKDKKKAEPMQWDTGSSDNNAALNESIQSSGASQAGDNFSFGNYVDTGAGSEAGANSGGVDFGDTSSYNDTLSQLISASGAAQEESGDAGGFNFDFSSLFNSPVSGGVTQNNGETMFNFGFDW